MSDAQNAQVAQGAPAPTAPAPSTSKRPKKVSPLERRFESFAQQTEERIDNVVNVVEKLGQLLNNFIDASDHKPVRPVEETAPEDEPVEDSLSQVVPPSWRSIIDRKLGRDFDAEVIASSDGLVLLHVYSPSRWDTRKGDEKRLSKRDLRVAPISRGQAIADVNKWCDRFAENIRLTYKHFSPNA